MKADRFKAHAGSPVMITCSPAGIRDFYGVDNPQDRAVESKWAQNVLKDWIKAGWYK